ncbi:BrnT family toxin, partial [Candidatus Latescibacterota bacterium]
SMEFEWHPGKDLANQRKHGVCFGIAQKAFLDRRRVIAVDRGHSTPGERRYFCFGRVDGRVLTVRFTVRGDVIRIFGAGYWREGRRRYDEENAGT